MTSWREMALENRVTAKEMLATDRFRASVNRSYYAVYCLMTSLLVGSVTFGYGNNNPTHSELPQYITDSLGGVSFHTRSKIESSFRALLNARAEADYLPQATIRRKEALDSVRDMDYIFGLLEVENE